GGDAAHGRQRQGARVARADRGRAAGIIEAAAVDAERRAGGRAAVPGVVAPARLGVDRWQLTVNWPCRVRPVHGDIADMIRKLKSGEYRLYSRKKNPKTGKRRNLGTFKTLRAAQQHERAVQFFKRH